MSPFGARHVRAAAVVAVAALCAAPGPALAGWRWPLRGEVIGRFDFTARRPFAAGQRRNLAIAARPGSTVRAACGGPVTHAGPTPRHGLAVSVRCGALSATHLGLGALSVRRGALVVAGEPVGVVGAAGVLRLGARMRARRWGYVDPLALLSGDAGPAPALPLGRAPRRRPAARAPMAARSPRPVPVRAPATVPVAAAPRGIPAVAWAGLVAIAAALPLGPLVVRRRRRRVPASTPVAERAP